MFSREDGSATAHPASFAVLTNRKRAIVALAHSIVFLLIALRGLILPKPLIAIWLRPADIQTSIGVLFIYALVSSILIKLVQVSRGRQEKLYFLFCATSATVGLFRNIVGDPAPYMGLLLRVVMLTCAVTVGIFIVRFHSPQDLRQTSA